MESELVVEMLARRMPKGALADGGEAPDRPSVVTDSRRRWSRAAAADTDSRPAEAAEVPLPLPYPFPGAETELLRWNREEKAAEVTEPRRSLEWPVPELSLDMMVKRRGQRG